MNAHPFPDHDHPARLGRLAAHLPAVDCDGFLVTKSENVRWLTGFTGSNGTVLVTSDRVVLLTDGRYREQAEAQLAAAAVDVELVVESVAVKEATQRAVEGVARLALEAAHVTWARQRRLAEDWLPDVTLVPTEGVVEAWRAVKEPGEVARIEAAAGIADAALASVAPLLAGGPTEAAFAFALEAAMRERGAAGPAFETIVATGDNGARPHARPGSRVVQRGDLVVIDFGALVDGYRSDMTRTVCVGPPSASQRRHFDVVVAAQRAARDAVAAGVAGRDVDAAARSVVEAAGWAEEFPHGTGHGIGLEVHEAPHVSRIAEDELVAGQVVTVEPGVYLPGVGGVRIEDTVVVTEGGCRSLTRFPKTLDLDGVGEPG